jgi:hypothetical protein
MGDHVCDEGVLEAGRAVRPFLAELVPPEVVAEVDADLAQLFARGSAADELAAAVRELLEAQEGTSAFLEQVLDDAPRFRPPQIVSELADRGGEMALPGYSELPGQTGPVRATKFRCPHGDYVWYRAEIGESPDRCPTHHCALDPV